MLDEATGSIYWMKSWVLLHFTRFEGQRGVKVLLAPWNMLEFDLMTPLLCRPYRWFIFAEDCLEEAAVSVVHDLPQPSRTRGHKSIFFVHLWRPSLATSGTFGWPAGRLSGVTKVIILHPESSCIHFLHSWKMFLDATFHKDVLVYFFYGLNGDFHVIFPSMCVIIDPIFIKYIIHFFIAKLIFQWNYIALPKWSRNSCTFGKINSLYFWSLSSSLKTLPHTDTQGIPLSSVVT